MIGLGDEGVEFGEKLLVRFEARLAAIEGRNVAKLAPIRATAGELERSNEIAREWDGVIERKGELDSDSRSRVEPALGRRRFKVCRQ